MISRIVRPLALLALLAAFIIAGTGAPARAGGFDQALGVWVTALETRLASLEEAARSEGVPVSTRIASMIPICRERCE